MRHSDDEVVVHHVLRWSVVYSCTHTMISSPTSQSIKMASVLTVPDQSQQFAHILRLLNTNVDGKRKIMYALTEIKGIGRRYANVVCKKADVDLMKRAGELNSDELERIVTILQNPQDFKIPHWFLNRQRGERNRHLAVMLQCSFDADLYLLPPLLLYRHCRRQVLPGPV